MLGFGKKKASASVPAPRERIVYRDRPEMVEAAARVERYLDLTEKEFGRLTIEIDRQLTKKEAGERYQKDELARSFGKLSMLASSVAAITGEDYLTVSVRMERKAQELISSGFEFPLNSYFGSGSPIFQSVVDAGYAQDRRLRG